MLVSESSGIARQNKDTILFVNAHIYPVDDIFSTADAMLIANGRIVELELEGTPCNTCLRKIAI
jgi:hypothetical protein